MTHDDDTRCKLSDVHKAQEQVGPDGQWLAGKTASRLLIASAYGLGGGGMAAWLFFIFWGPWGRLTPRTGVAASLMADALLCLVFFIQHSTMVRRGFRLWLIRIVRAEFHGALYASLSGTCLLMLVLFWQPVGLPLWAPSAGIRWAMASVLLLVAAGAW
jgi:hypothetical protein